MTLTEFEARVVLFHLRRGALQDRHHAVDIAVEAHGDLDKLATANFFLNRAEDAERVIATIEGQLPSP